MRVDFLSMERINAPFMPQIEETITKIAKSGRYLLGPYTKLFEDSICQAHQMPPGSVVATSNGLDSLRLIFKALIILGKLSKGDEVIVPANTYIASILPLSEMGLIPVPVEPDTTTFNIDWHKALQAITPRTKAMLIVHLYGTPCWDHLIAQSIINKNILIIEDNAQAIGARASHNGINQLPHTGTLGHAAAFSFYPTKNIGAFGDAGLVMSHIPEITSTVKALANYGSDTRYHNIFKGYNCRIDEIQAAILHIKMQQLHSITFQRTHAANLYNNAISNPLIIKPAIMPNMQQVWHQYVIRVQNRDQFRSYLAQHGITTDIHYACPPHLQPCYKGEFTTPLPITEHIANQVVSLPIASATDQEILYTASIINQWSPTS